MKKIIALALACLMSASLLAGCQQPEQVSIASPEDLTGHTVGVQAGTTGETYCNESVEGIDVKSYKSGLEAAMDLKNGQIDAVVLDELPAKEIVKQNPELKIIDKELTTEDYAIAVKKGNQELLDSINETLARIKEDGTYDELVKAFMPADGNIVLPEMDLGTNTEVLKMGTNAAFPPFEYIDSTEPVGFDICVANEIAKDYGKKLEVVDMNFDSLITALNADQIDFVAAGMSATEERKQAVDFSDPYFSATQVIIVRK